MTNGRLTTRAGSIGLLGTIGALLAYGGYRVAEWTHFLAGHAYGHRSDFAEYYLTASIGERFGWSAIYSSSARDAVVKTFSAPPMKNFPIDFPPSVGWVVRPFTALSIDGAYWIWFTALMVAYVITWWLVTDGSLLKRLVLLVAPLTLFPVVFGYTLGQVVGFELLGVAVAFVCLGRKWDFWAGLALSPMLLHPQCLLLVPLVLLPLRRWRAVVGFVLSAAVQGGLMVAVLGASGVHAFVHQVNYVHAHRIEIWTTLSIPLAVHVPAASVAGIVAVVVAVVVVAGSNRDDPRTAFAAAIIGSLLVAPFIHAQDEMSLVVAGWLLLAGRFRWETSVLASVAFGVMAFAGPSTKFFWGYVVMGMESIWLIALLVQSLSPVGAHFFPERRNARIGYPMPPVTESPAELFWRAESHFLAGDLERRASHS